MGQALKAAVALAEPMQVVEDDLRHKDLRSHHEENLPFPSRRKMTIRFVAELKGR